MAKKMSRKEATRNMETKRNLSTPSSRKRASEARSHGRGDNQAFTSGARSANKDDSASRMKDAWNLAEGKTRGRNNGRFVSKQESMKQGNVATYTHTKRGAMSVDGRRAGGTTWAMTPKDDKGNYLTNKDGSKKQSGRSRLEDGTRDHRRYDVVRGLTNLRANQKTAERMGGYTGLRSRGLTDDEIRTIYGIGPNGSYIKSSGRSVG